MGKLKKFTIFLLSAIILTTSSLGLFGCSSGNKERQQDGSNTLYVGYVGTSFPSSYMPWQSRDGIAPTLSSMIYSTLFSYDDLTGEFMPNLAKDWCYVDKEGNPIETAEGKVDYDRLDEIYGNSSSIPVKITLFDNAKWSDGERVTVEDVYYSYDLCANNVLSGHAGALAWVTDLQHKYTNGKLSRNGMFTYYHNNKYNITEEEKDTVMYFNVNTVLGAVTTLFTTILILPEHVWKPVVSAENQANSTSPNQELRHLYSNPIGCGPYELDVENSNAQVVVLKRREDYHQKDPIDPTKPLYKVDKIRFILYQEQNVAIFSLLKGYIDVLDSSINANYRVLFNKEKDMQVLEADNPFVQTLVINMNPTTSNQTKLRTLLMNKDFRKAIALAIDQQDLIKNVQDGAANTYSMGLVSNTLTEIYNENIYEDEELSVFDKPLQERLDLANGILDKIVPNKDGMGYRLYEGKRVSYEIMGNPSTQDLVSFLQIQFQKIGIEVKYTASGSSPENTYLYPGKFDMTLQGVTFTSSTVDIMMNSHFVTLGKSSNYGRLIDANLTEKIDEMRTTINLNRKNQLLKELQVEVAKEYYKLPLYSSKMISVARTDRYTGWIAPSGATAFNTDALQVIERVS